MARISKLEEEVKQSKRRGMQVSRRSSKERGYQNEDNSDLDVINYANKPSSSNSKSRSKSTDMNVWHPSDNRMHDSVDRANLHTLPERSNSRLNGPMRPYTNSSVPINITHKDGVRSL